MTDDRPPHVKADTDPQETREWLDSLEYVLETSGADRAAYLFERLRDRLAKWGAWLPPPIQHTLRQYDPSLPRAALPRQSRNRTPDPQPRSLERDGHGREG